MDNISMDELFEIAQDYYRRSHEGRLEALAVDIAELQAAIAELKAEERTEDKDFLIAGPEEDLAALYRGEADLMEMGTGI